MLQVVNICTQVISKGVYSYATFSKEGHIKNISQIFLIKQIFYIFFIFTLCICICKQCFMCAVWESHEQHNSCCINIPTFLCRHYVHAFYFWQITLKPCLLPPTFFSVCPLHGNWPSFQATLKLAKKFSFLFFFFFLSFILSLSLSYISKCM